VRRPRDPGEESEDRTREDPLDEDVRDILRDLARSINDGRERWGKIIRAAGLKGN